MTAPCRFSFGPRATCNLRFICRRGKAQNPTELLEDFPGLVLPGALEPWTAHLPTHQPLLLPKPVRGELTQHEAESRFSKERRTGVNGNMAQTVWKERGWNAAGARCEL